MEKVLSLPQIQQRTQEWYDRRNGLLTASDAAAALGINPYQSRKSLLIKKCNPGDEYRGNAFTKHGNLHEDEARDLLGTMYNVKTNDVGLFIHPEHEWLGGSPDGITEDGVLIEIKCPLSRLITHDIPKYYYPQVQICMEILDIELCYFVQYKPETITNVCTFDILHVKRDRKWFDRSLPELRKFWEDVMQSRLDGSLSKKIDESRVIDLRPLGICEPNTYYDSDDECLIESDDEN